MRLIDLTGKRVGRLLVLGRDESAKTLKPEWRCVCDCGTVKSFHGSDLRLSQTLSCGCLRNERVRATITKHGDAPRSGKTPEYNVWCAMIKRCENPSEHDAPYYRDKGISVCARWRESYAAFIADMGLRPSPKHTIDRVENDGNYEPGNCRWATWPEQRRNTRAYIEKHGVQNA